MDEKKVIGGSDKDDADIIKRIDAKMGEGWAKRLTDALSAPLTKDAEVSFTFDKAVPEDKDSQP